MSYPFGDKNCRKISIPLKQETYHIWHIHSIFFTSDFFGYFNKHVKSPYTLKTSQIFFYYCIMYHPNIQMKSISGIPKQCREDFSCGEELSRLHSPNHWPKILLPFRDTSDSNYCWTRQSEVRGLYVNPSSCFNHKENTESFS